MTFLNTTLFLGFCLTSLVACGSSQTPSDDPAQADAIIPSVLIPAIDLANTTASPSNVAVVLLDTGASTTGFASGQFTHTTSQARIGGGSYGIARGTNQYVANVNGGGKNRLIALETPTGGLPGGSAIYSGTANMEYVDTPSGNTFRGTLDATVTASLIAGGTVSIDLTNPSGTFGGAPYVGGGRVDIDGLVITGSRYNSVGGSSASITGFVGATGLNSGAQTVDASGVFGGGAAQETGAAAVIADGVNGLAVLDLTGKR